MSAGQLTRLIFRVLRTGKLRHSGHDFAQAREQLLAGLPAFNAMPGVKQPGALPANPILRMLVSEAAFVKNNLRVRGQHLSTGDKKLVYVRIPKAASTAMCKAVLADTFGYATLDARQVNALADTRTEYSLPTYADDPEVFTVVRNPFSRLVSVYRAFFEDREGPFLYEDYLMGILKRDLAFREFVKIVADIPDKLKDQHLKPQSRMLEYYDKRKVPVHILRFEDTGGIREFLTSRELKFEIVHDRAQRYNFADYYDHESLELTKTIYAADISRFGYDAEYRELKSVIEQRAVQN